MGKRHSYWANVEKHVTIKLRSLLQQVKHKGQTFSYASIYLQQGVRWLLQIAASALQVVSSASNAHVALAARMRGSDF
jgi:phage gp46-like protein